MKPSEVLKACLNPKVLMAIGVVILLAYIFAPELAGFARVLVALACPLSMIFMMGAMSHESDTPEKLFVCPECGYSYKDAEWAKKCAAWCKEHKSCNLDITQHAIQKV